MLNICIHFNSGFWGFCQSLTIGLYKTISLVSQCSIQCSINCSCRFISFTVWVNRDEFFYDCPITRFSYTHQSFRKYPFSPRYNSTPKDSIHRLPLATSFSCLQDSSFWRPLADKGTVWERNYIALVSFIRMIKEYYNDSTLRRLDFEL